MSSWDGKFKTNTANINNLGTAGFTAGMNIKKLNDFAQDINFNVKKIIAKIDDTKSLQAQLDASWQGASRDRFVKDLNDAIGNLKWGIDMEYRDFMSRLQDLADNMYKQDKDLYRE